MYRVNDIFYSIQGEGRNTGRAAVFVRFAGCNLRCSFCDTEFDTFREMTADEIVAAISAYPSRFVVLTGGEPTLQVDEAFIDLLHQHGFEVAMESNGTRPAPQNLDWLTVSPKSLLPDPSRSASGRLLPTGRKKRSGKMPDELKVVFTTEENLEQQIASLPLLGDVERLYLQPCDTGDAERNAIIINRCIDYIKEHPQWRLSLQTHKLVGFK